MLTPLVHDQEPSRAQGYDSIRSLGAGVKVKSPQRLQKHRGMFVSIPCIPSVFIVSPEYHLKPFQLTVKYQGLTQDTE